MAAVPPEAEAGLGEAAHQLRLARQAWSSAVAGSTEGEPQELCAAWDAAAAHVEHLRTRLLHAPSPSTWRLFLNLPDELARHVVKLIPSGPDSSNFRAVCQTTRRLANGGVTHARVADWQAARQMGRTFPRLEKLEVTGSSRAELHHAHAFLALSAKHLLGLVSLDVANTPRFVDAVDLAVLLLACSSLPQLQRLGLPQLVAGTPLLAVMEAVVQLQHLTSLRLGIKDCSGTEVGAPMDLLKQLPHLISLDLGLGADVAAVLASVRKLTGLDTLVLVGVPDTAVDAEPLCDLVALTYLTFCSQGGATRPDAFHHLGRMTQLLHLRLVLEATPQDVAHLSRLQRLTELTSSGSLRGEALKVLGVSTLRSLDLWSITADASNQPPPACSVTSLRVGQLQPVGAFTTTFRALKSLGLLQGLGEDLAQQVCSFTKLTSLCVEGGRRAQPMTRAVLQSLAGLPQLSVVTLDRVAGLTDEVLRGLVALTGLTRLRLANLPAITDDSVSLAALLPQIRCLEVVNCNHTAAEATKALQRMVAARGGAGG